MPSPNEKENQATELTDNDLEDVAGGYDPSDGGCIPDPWKKPWDPKPSEDRTIE